MITNELKIEECTYCKEKKEVFHLRMCKFMKELDPICRDCLALFENDELTCLVDRVGNLEEGKVEQKERARIAQNREGRKRANNYNIQ